MISAAAILKPCRTERARRWREGLPFVVYCVFDLLVHGGRDVRSWPLARRKATLSPLLDGPRPSILYVQHVVGEGAWLFERVRALQLEGMIAKRLDSIYRSGERSAEWLKIKRSGAVPAQRFKR